MFGNLFKGAFSKGVTYTAWDAKGKFSVQDPKTGEYFDVPNDTILTVQACEGDVVIVTADKPASKFLGSQKLPAGTLLKTHTFSLSLIDSNRRKHETEARATKKLLSQVEG